MRTHFIHSNKLFHKSTGSTTEGKSVSAPHRAPRSNHSRSLLGVAVIGVMIMMTAACSTLPISGSSASGIVTSAVQEVGASTSNVNLHMTLNAGSISLTEDGTGSMNVPQGALELNAGTTIFGLTFPGKMELDNGIVYTSVSFPATIVTLGKTWLSINLTKLGISSSDVPAILALIWDLPSLMKMLGSGGNFVTSLGTSTVDNQTVTGYAIKLPTTLLSGMTPSCLSSSSSGINLSKMTLKIDAYVNSSNRLVRLVTDVSMPAQVIGTVSAAATIDFTGYGSAVNILPPPSNTVDNVTPLVQDAYSMICPNSGSKTTTS